MRTDHKNEKIVFLGGTGKICMSFADTLQKVDASSYKIMFGSVDRFLQDDSCDEKKDFATKAVWFRGLKGEKYLYDVCILSDKYIHDNLGSRAELVEWIESGSHHLTMISAHMFMLLFSVDKKVNLYMASKEKDVEYAELIRNMNFDCGYVGVMDNDESLTTKVKGILKDRHNISVGRIVTHRYIANIDTSNSDKIVLIGAEEEEYIFSPAICKMVTLSTRFGPIRFTKSDEEMNLYISAKKMYINYPELTMWFLIWYLRIDCSDNLDRKLKEFYDVKVFSQRAFDIAMRVVKNELLDINLNNLKPPMARHWEAAGSIFMEYVTDTDSEERMERILCFDERSRKKVNDYKCLYKGIDVDLDAAIEAYEAKTKG